MAISIIVEDGTIVPGANSYADLAYIRQYAADRGVALPVDDDELAAMVIKSTDYLQSFCCEYMGRPATTTQDLCFPRAGLFAHEEELPPNFIPRNLKAAQAVAVMLINAGEDLLPVIGPADYVIEDTVGPLTTKYANPVEAGIGKRFKAIDALLASLFGECGQWTGLRSHRV